MIISKNIKFFIVLIWLFWGSVEPAFSGSTKFVSNYDFLQQTTSEAFKQLFESLELNTAGKFTVTAHPADANQAWFINNCVYRVLKEFGFIDIYFDSCGIKNKSEGTVYHLFYKIIELKLDYEPESGWSFKTNKMLSRSAKTQFFVQISDCRSRKLLWSGEIRNEKTDSVSLQQARKFQSSALPVPNPKIPAYGLVKRFIEPVLAISVSGAIIYLFYVLRSQ